MPRPTLHAIRVALVAALTLSSVAVRAAGAAPAAPAAQPGPATTLKSQQWDFTSKVNGRAYRVQVAMPSEPPPPSGYPVVYVTDGAGFFGALTDVTRVRTMGGEVAPAVIVGISYPEDDMTVQMSRRTLDLTQVDADAGMKAEAAKLGGKPGEYAGADNFLTIIETEIKPRVAALAKTDPARSILYGHSLGGLFTLHVLFTRPAAFQTYLISSPSIWWRGKDVLKDEAAFARAVSDRKVAPRIFIVVGGEEQTVPLPPYPPGITREYVEKMTVSAAMVDNARALAARLAALPGAPGYAVASQVYAGESHMSIPFASFNALAKFALPK
ncbi:alpha/beta hydrolase [Sandarakinorhabdus limnophila]|uniref:alpha/beta hydrolase n=1 Tax=Sandarakinorhabdus limnophila TaxID=210512 RepID=UPI0026EA088D|nr:alpha/beta hydrolase-fold protein [Sandarakinorhabdus limnophila]